MPWRLSLQDASVLKGVCHGERSLVQVVRKRLRLPITMMTCVKRLKPMGNTFFPRVQGRPLYGSLVLTVSVDAEGRITNNVKGREGIEVSRSSGIPGLDRQAVAIVRAVAPFGAFPREMLQQIDVLDWVSTFEFTRDLRDQSGSQLELRGGKP